MYESALFGAGRYAAPLFCILLLAACSKHEPEPPKPQLVSAAIVAPDADAQAWWVAGQIAAREATPLSFRVDGKILRRRVALGNEVKAGDILAELDPEPLRQGRDSAHAQLQAAKEALAFANHQWERDRKQAKADLISQVQLEQSRNQRAQAQAQYTQAQKAFDLAADRLDYALLRSSHDGVITAEHAQTGQNVAAGQPVYTLAWGSHLDVLCNVSERQVGKLSVGQAAQVSVNAFPDQRYAATIREIAPAADPATRSFRIKLTLDQTATQARLGMTAAVWFPASIKGNRDLVSVPATALFHDGNATAVWLITPDDTLALQAVAVERYEADRVIVSDGLKPGDAIVAQGVHTVSAGQHVRRSPLASHRPAPAARTAASEAQASTGRASP